MAWGEGRVLYFYMPKHLYLKRLEQYEDPLAPETMPGEWDAWEPADWYDDYALTGQAEAVQQEAPRGEPTWMHETILKPRMWRVIILVKREHETPFPTLAEALRAYRDRLAGILARAAAQAGLPPGELAGRA